MTLRSSLYTHTQELASECWTVQHDLNTYPAVEAFTLADESDTKIIPVSITYTNKNVCVLEFMTPQIGVAITI